MDADVTTGVATPNQDNRGEILTLGFGTTVAMWTAGYICRFPAVQAPGWVLLPLMLVCLVGGGVLAGRLTSKGWQGGLYIGLVTALLNLLILGSVLTGDQPNTLHPPMLWWLPGWFLASAAIGAVAGIIGRSTRKGERPVTNWTFHFVGVLALATLLLLIAGGLVTAAQAGLAVVDWPNSYGYNMFLYPLSRMTGGIYYEHAHRLLGSLVGLTTLFAAIQITRVRPLSWLKFVAWGAFLLVCIQGLLGGLRVTGKLTTTTNPEEVAPSITLAIIHGTVGQIFFALVTAMLVFASTSWLRKQEKTEAVTAGTDRAFGVLLLILLVIQLVLGAILRHIAGGLLMHISMAIIVVLAGVNNGVRAWGLYPNQPILQRFGKYLMALLGVQIGLGIAAYAATGMTTNAQSPHPLDLAITTTHQITGALILAVAVGLCLWSFRLLKPMSPAAQSRPTVDVSPAQG